MRRDWDAIVIGLGGIGSAGAPWASPRPRPPAGGAAGGPESAGGVRGGGGPLDRLDAAETMRRWPQWRLAEDTAVVYQSETGIADPNRANPAHRALATANGATLLERMPVTGMRASGAEYEVVTAAGTVHSPG